MEDILDTGNDDDTGNEITDASRSRFKAAGAWMIVSGICGLIFVLLCFYQILKYDNGRGWNFDAWLTVIFLLYFLIRSITIMVAGSGYSAAFATENIYHMKDVVKRYHFIWVLGSVFCAAFLFLWLSYLGGAFDNRFGIIQALFKVF